MKKDIGGRHCFLIIACLILFTVCGCPRPVAYEIGYGYLKLVGDESRPRYDFAAKCSIGKMYDMIVDVEQSNWIPRESNGEILRRTRNYLFEDGRTTHEDKIVLYGWHEGSATMPVWGHLLIIKYDRATESSSVQIVKQVIWAFDSRPPSLFKFDWVSALQTECRKRGYVVL